MKEGMITLSQEQLKTLTVINRFIDRSVSRQQAAELLGLSTRQNTRLKKGVLASGAESLIHKNTGRKPSHVVSDETEEAILSISYAASSGILKNASFESPQKNPPPYTPQETKTLARAAYPD